MCGSLGKVHPFANGLWVDQDPESRLRIFLQSDPASDIINVRYVGHLTGHNTHIGYGTLCSGAPQNAAHLLL